VTTRKEARRVTAAVAEEEERGQTKTSA